MKKYFILLSIIVLFPATAYADESYIHIDQTIQSSSHTTVYHSVQQTVTTGNTQGQITTLPPLSLPIGHQQVLQRIDNQISLLTSKLQFYTQNSSLSAAEKAAVTKEIQTEINQLNALKQQIQQGHFQTNIKSNTGSIVGNTVFSKNLSRPTLTTILTKLNTLTTTITTTLTSAQNMTNTLHSEGKNTTDAQHALTDANSRLQTVTALLHTETQEIQQNSTSSATIHQVKNDMRTIKKEFLAIRGDIEKFRLLLHILVPTITPTPS